MPASTCTPAGRRGSVLVSRAETQSEWPGWGGGATGALMLKIAICTPAYGDVAVEYASSLGMLMLRTGRTAVNFNGVDVLPELDIFVGTSSLLPQLRNQLLKAAADWGANYLLWIDGDQSFPDDALLRLLSLNLPVVGVNYPRRAAPHYPTAVGLNGELLYTTEAAARAGEVVPVLSMGFGCCLMDMTIFEAIHSRALADGKSEIGPLFAMELLGDGTRYIGEDVYFFRRAREAGVEVYVDQLLSWSIGHVGKRVFTHADIESLD
jgi:hypothetical protein